MTIQPTRCHRPLFCIKVTTRFEKESILNREKSGRGKGLQGKEDIKFNDAMRSMRSSLSFMFLYLWVQIRVRLKDQAFKMDDIEIIFKGNISSMEIDRILKAGSFIYALCRSNLFFIMIQFKNLRMSRGLTILLNFFDF